MSNEIATLAGRAAEYAVASHGAGTARVYRSQWAGWLLWCRAHEVCPLPADQAAIAQWLAWRADGGASLATIRVGLAALKHAHKLADHPLSLGRAASMTLEGISRKLGSAPGRQARAATVDKIKAMLAATRNVRDKAILLIGFGAGLRRSEIAALDLADVAVEDRGLLVTVRSSKTDQQGRGEVLAIAGGPPGFDPVAAFMMWVNARGASPGALFGILIGSGPDRTIARFNGRSIHRIIVAAAERAKLGDGWSGHSLRAGMITAAVAAGASIEDAARQARHTRIETTAGYVRHETAWQNNATSAIFGAKR